MSTYSDKLKDPRWQRKRLEIMSRDHFSCVVCRSKDKTLNVHHKQYVNGIDPWDHEDATLLTMCEDCHKREHTFMDEAIKMITKTLRKKLNVTGLILLNKMISDHNKILPDYYFQVVGRFLEIDGSFNYMLETLIKKEAEKDAINKNG